MRRGWQLALIPALLGGISALLLAPTPWATMRPFIEMNLPLWLVSIGALLSAISLGLVWGKQRWERARQATVAETQRLAAEERRRFLQRLDHELKNPLTALRVGLANLAAGVGDPAQGETLSGLEAQIVRLSRLTADLRKLAELEDRPLEFATINVADLLQEAVAAAQEQPQAQDRRLTLTLPQAPWPLSPLSGDWDLLFLAVYNLLSNALKFTQPGDTVEVRAFEDEATIVIEVADTGPGIAEGELSLVWEELYRGQNGRSIVGSGLGLALVKAIIERHNGQVSLRSRTEQGTVVSVRLPANRVTEP